MAKKKNQQIDWKFIIILVGIVMVGLSVWALNQRVSYRSDAANNIGIRKDIFGKAGCDTFNYNQCLAQCGQEFPKNSNDSPSVSRGDKAKEPEGSGWKYRGPRNSKGLNSCKKYCSSMARACKR